MHIVLNLLRKLSIQNRPKISQDSVDIFEDTHLFPRTSSWPIHFHQSPPHTSKVSIDISCTLFRSPLPLPASFRSPPPDRTDPRAEAKLQELFDAAERAVPAFGELQKALLALDEVRDGACVARSAGTWQSAEEEVFSKTRWRCFQWTWHLAVVWDSGFLSFSYPQ